MSELKPKLRNGTYYAFGTVNGKRIRRSLKTGDHGRAKELCAQFEARLWKRSVYGDEAVRTFEEAAVVYLRQGGEGRFLPRILHHFKGRVVGNINPGDVREAAMHLYPKASSATRNRQAIIPTRAVINAAAEMGWCSHIRVKLFPVPKSRKHMPVDRSWLDAFMAQADRDGLPHLSALVLFMNQTAARRSEAVNLLGAHVDLEQRIAVLAKTKTEEWSVRHLTAELALRIGALGLQDDQPVFRYTTAPAVNRRMQSVCKRADIPYRSTHSAGRHSFGTNAMKLPGTRIRQAMDAGGWKSAKLFMETYVHEQDAGRDLVEKMDAQTGPVGTDLAQASKQKRYHFGNNKK